MRLNVGLSNILCTYLVSKTSYLLNRGTSTPIGLEFHRRNGKARRFFLDTWMFWVGSLM